LWVWICKFKSIIFWMHTLYWCSKWWVCQWQFSTFYDEKQHQLCVFLIFFFLEYHVKKKYNRYFIFKLYLKLWNWTHLLLCELIILMLILLLKYALIIIDVAIAYNMLSIIDWLTFFMMRKDWITQTESIWTDTFLIMLCRIVFSSLMFISLSEQSIK